MADFGSFFRSAAKDFVGGFTAETIEFSVKNLDPKTVTKYEMAARAAYIYKSVPTEARRALTQVLTSSLRQMKRVDPAITVGLTAVIDGLFRGADDMLDKLSQEELAKLIVQKTDERVAVMKAEPENQLWIALGMDSIHASAVHQPDMMGIDMKNVTSGDPFTILRKYGHLKGVCPCTRSVLGEDFSKVKLPDANASGEAAKQPDPNVLRQLKKIKSKPKRDFLLALFLHAFDETRRDPHDGLEGVANLIVNAITFATIDDPEILADYIRDDPPKLKKTNPEDPDVDIFRAADQEISALLLYYQQKHPDSDRMVKARDAADALWSFRHFSWLPTSWRPKPSSEWAQWVVKNMKFAAWVVGGTLLFILLVALFILLVAVVIAVAGLCNIGRITVMLQEYYLPSGAVIEPGLLKIYYGVAYLWLFRFAVTAAEKVGLAIKDLVTPAATERDTARLGNVGFFIVTITMASSAIMAVLSLYATAQGQITSVVMGLFLATLCTVLATLEFRKLFRQFVTDDQRAKETLQFSSWMLKATLALITALLIMIVVNYFAPRSSPGKEELAATQERSIVGESYTQARQSAIQRIDGVSKPSPSPKPVPAKPSSKPSPEVCSKIGKMLKASPDLCRVSPGLDSCARARQCGLVR